MNLLPCPFCGGEPRLESEKRYPGKTVIAEDAYAYYYVCNSCACHGGWAKSETSALRLWNMRTTTTP